MTSLWLVDSDDGGILRGIIDKLAEEHGCQAFTPHVTLLTGMADDVDVEVVERELRKIVVEIDPLHTLRFDRLVDSAMFFQCVVGAVERTPALLELHERVKAAFPPVKAPPNPSYFPHLSLLYANMDHDKRKEVMHAISPQWAAGLVLGGRANFRPVAIQLVRTSSPIADWTPLLSIPLSLAPGRGV